MEELSVGDPREALGKRIVSCLHCGRYIQTGDIILSLEGNIFLESHVRLSGNDALLQSDSAEGSDDEHSDTLRDDVENGKGCEGSSDGEDGGDEDGGDEDGHGGTGNGGWAMAMAKILGKKTPVSTSSILVKNQELDKIKEKAKQELLERKKQVDKKRVWETMCREKPSVVKDRESERALQRIATRGVVQLFNAVRTHQKTVDNSVKESGSSERKKAKLLSSVSKKDFIDVLRRTEGGSKGSVNNVKSTAESGPGTPNWSVLNDDFMMGATMKDWDKDSETEDADAPSRK